MELGTNCTTYGAAPHAQIRPRLVRRLSQCKGTAVPSLTPEKRLFVLVGVLFRNLTPLDREIKRTLRQEHRWFYALRYGRIAVEQQRAACSRAAWESR